MLINLILLRTRLMRLSIVAIFCLSLQACLGTIIGTTADVAIEVAKIPFKVGGAVIDIAIGDGKSDSNKEKAGKKDKHQDQHDDDEESSSNRYQRAI